MEENNNTAQQNDGAQINPSNIITRVVGILTKPKQEWDKIAKETPNTTGIMVGYAVPLALIPTIATIIGMGVIGKKVGFGFGSITLKSWGLGITSGLTTFIVSLAAIYITALIVDALAPSFKSEKNMGRSLQLAVYGYTPAWIAGILNIIPALSWISFLAGLYGIYLMFLAFGPLKKTPEDKKAVYLLSTIGILIVTYFILALIVGIIIGLIYAPKIGSFGF